MEVENIVIAGGGTGGHVYPGLAVAKALNKIAPEARVHFVGTKRGIECRVVEKEGFRLHLVSVLPLHRSVGFVSRFKSALLLPWGLLQCVFICLKLRPKAVLGVGGYASGPFLLMARLLGFKTAIWEPNAMPGLANRLLSAVVHRAYVVFPSARKFLKTRDTRDCGMPVRFEMAPAEACAGDGKFHILIFGGSQGARAINTVVKDAVVRGGGWLNGLRIVHQTGPHDFKSVRAAYENLKNPDIEVHEYLHDMEARYREADLVICRGGASTLAELMACGKPAVIVPLPTAADDHQRKNAEEMRKNGAAEMLLQKDLSVEKLVETVLRLKNDPGLLVKTAENARRMHKPGAAEGLARDLLRP